MESSNTYPERHRAYRDRLKARGLRQVVLWVPDTRRPGFAEEMRRQMALVDGDSHDQADLDFIESVADWTE